jgi:hypothetical protein
LTHAFLDERAADIVLDLTGRKFVTLRADVGPCDNGTVQFQVLVDGKVRHQTPVMRFGAIEPISVDVAGAKEVVLRVLNGGDGNSADSAGWGYARFLQAGTRDPLEEPPSQHQSATEADAALFLATIHRRLDQTELARRWYNKAVEWMDKYKVEAEKLEPFRFEAARLLGITEETSTQEEKPK